MEFIPTKFITIYYIIIIMGIIKLSPNSNNKEKSRNLALFFIIVFAVESAISTNSEIKKNWWKRKSDWERERERESEWEPKTLKENINKGKLGKGFMLILSYGSTYRTELEKKNERNFLSAWVFIPLKSRRNCAMSVLQNCIDLSKC